MPTYRVKDEQTGLVIDLTGDSPPTDSELEEIFAQESASGNAGNTFAPSDDAVESGGQGIATYAPSEANVESDSPGAGKIVTGLGVEIGSSIGGQLGGAALGTAILPGVGTAIGYVLGSISGGIGGSIAAQEIEGRDDISWGRAIGAGLAALIPGGAGKGITGATKITGAMIARAAAKEAARGSVMGATEATARAVVDEGRAPTKEELITYGGLGAVFGGALGSATPKISKTISKFLGKTAREIDDGIINGTITEKDLKLLKPDMSDREIKASIISTRVRGESEAAVESLIEPTSAWKRFQSMVAPSKVVGKEARNEMLSFRKLANAAEEMGTKVGGKITKTIAKAPEADAHIAEFMAGGKLDPSLNSIKQDLLLYRKTLTEHRVSIADKIDSDFLASAAPGTIEKLSKEINDLMQGMSVKGVKKVAKAKMGNRITNKKKKIFELQKPQRVATRFRTSRDSATGQPIMHREYRMWTDSEFMPDIKLRGAALNEVADNIQAKSKSLSRGDAIARAEMVMSKHEGSSARSQSLDPSNSAPMSAVDSALKKRENIGPAQRAWLGEITDSGERARGTLSSLGKMVARQKTDENIIDILVKNGMAIKGDVDTTGMLNLRLRSGLQEGYYVMPEVQASVTSLYLDGGIQRSNNPIIAGLQDLYSTAVGLSKATKVLLNPPSYAVQVYGNTMNLAGMGVNPFAGAARGMRLALADFGGLEHMLSPKGAKEYSAFIREMNDMTKYGIKGENIAASEMRDALRAGVFSKAAEKPVGFFGKAYSIPDTVGRYIGWQAQIRTIKKMYPGIDSEQAKRIGAEMINDFYQNYDRTSPVMKRLARMGVMPQFATFTAEFMRNQYNQAKAIKQMLGGTFGADLGLDLTKANLKAMRAEGAKRATTLIALYGGTGGTIAAINSDGGVNETNDAAIREGLPPWDRDKSLAIRMSADGKSGSYANMSYIAPHALGLAAVSAAMSDAPLDGLSSLLVDELIGDGSFVNRGLMDAVNNRNGRTGNKISYNENDLINAKERLGHFFAETFRPGFLRETDKLDQALRGVGDLTTQQVLARQVGYRVNSFVLAENYRFIMREHIDNANGSKYEFTKARNYGNLRPEELEAVYQKANAAYKQSMQGIARADKNLSNTNHTELERIDVMKKAGVSGKDILSILGGGEVHDIPKIERVTASSVWMDDVFPLSDKERIRYITQVSKTDAPMAKALMSRNKSDILDRHRNVSPVDSLIRSLGVSDGARAYYLYAESNKYENPAAYIDGMVRKGLVTSQVWMQIQTLRGAGKSSGGSGSY